MAGIRDLISRNVSTFTFLVFYFLTIVAGNVMYATPFGADALRLTGFPTEALSFPETFSPGYWVLLLMPLVAAPIGVVLLRPLLTKIVGPMSSGLPDMRKADYLVIWIIVYGAVAFIFWRTGAFTLGGSGADAISAVEARFALQAKMHFYEKILIHAIMPCVAFYAVVAALRIGGVFWSVLAVAGVALATVFLIAVAMKWPVLVFFIGILAALFTFSQRYAYTKTIIGGVALVAMYLVISTYVFRIVAPPAETPRPVPPVVVVTPPEGEPAKPPPPATDQSVEESTGSRVIRMVGYAESLVSSATRFAPLLFAHAVNRMAIAYPYYYHVFTSEGPVCGSVIDQAQTSSHVKCRPSWLIYTRIFGKDGFEGRGTAPAAPHIYGYALGGWPIAIAGMIGIIIVLSAFSAIPLGGNLLSNMLTVVGVTTAYHLSQIPGEGVIFYDHGFAWPLVAIAVYAVFRYATRRLSPRS